MSVIAVNPEFDIIPDHEFKEGEKVYVIDPNGYDMWEAIILKKNKDKFSVHYPEYSDDDEELTGTARMLVKNKNNIELYKKMEEQRMINSKQESSSKNTKSKSSKKTTSRRKSEKRGNTKKNNRY